MRGGSIIAGALALIVLETLGRKADAAGKGLDWLSGGVTRLFSADVALIPRAKGTAPKTAPKTAPGTTQGGSGGNVGEASTTLPRNPVVTT